MCLSWQDVLSIQPTVVSIQPTLAWAARWLAPTGPVPPMQARVIEEASAP